MARGLSLLIALGFAACLACSDGAPWAHGGNGPDESDAVAVRVAGLALDAEVDSPIVILAEADGERRLPIWIGAAEAHSIASELEARTPIRPNTHDLAQRLIEGLDGTVRRIVVTDLRGGIYYARIDLDQGDRQVSIDSRPSDAIAIALRLDAPLFVRDRVFELSDTGKESAGRPIRGRASGRQIGGQRL
jgi:bifunctional DNase/RNase